MEKPFQLVIFGKVGCEKCKVLNKRVDALLRKPEGEDFEKVYCDVETVDGLVVFCRSECVNPQRIPALMVTRRDPATGSYDPVPNPRPGAEDAVCGQSRLYTHLGLQTDYSDKGRGLITPKMIASVVREAASLSAD